MMAEPADPLSERLDVLGAIAPDDFVRKGLASAAEILRNRALPLRLNLFAASVRMLLEHVMGPLAPTDQVEACSWYKPFEKEKKPIRAQRIQYWLQGGLSDDFLSETLNLEPAEMRKELLAAFNELSKHVHGRVDTVVDDPAAQDAEAAGIIDAIENLLTTYHDCRSELIEPLVDELDEGAMDALLSETILSVDELASHHSIDSIDIEATEVVSIGAREVRYAARGTVDVTLQFGSNGDLRREDGAELDENFPFSVTFDVPIDDPRDLARAEIISGVDTSAWYGHDREDEVDDDIDIDTSLEGKTFDIRDFFADEDEDPDGRPAF